MLKQAAAFAEPLAGELRKAALVGMNQMLGREVQRLQMLRQVNDHIRPEEIELAVAQQAELAKALGQSRIRLEGVRLIWKEPPEMLG